MTEVSVSSEFSVVSKEEILLEGSLTFKVVLGCYEGPHQGRVGITISKEQFDKIVIGQKVQVALSFRPILRAV